MSLEKLELIRPQCLTSSRRWPSHITRVHVRFIKRSDGSPLRARDFQHSAAGTNLNPFWGRLTVYSIDFTANKKKPCEKFAQILWHHILLKAAGTSLKMLTLGVLELAFRTFHHRQKILRLFSKNDIERRGYVIYITDCTFQWTWNACVHNMKLIRHAWSYIKIHESCREIDGC